MPPAPVKGLEAWCKLQTNTGKAIGRKPLVTGERLRSNGVIAQGVCVCERGGKCRQCHCHVIKDDRLRCQRRQAPCPNTLLKDTSLCFRSVQILLLTFASSCYHQIIHNPFFKTRNVLNFTSDFITCKFLTSFIYLHFSNTEQWKSVLQEEKRRPPWHPDTPRPVSDYKTHLTGQNLGSHMKMVQPPAASCLLERGQSLQFMCRPLEWELV